MVWAIIAKDVRMIMRNRQVWLPMLVLPLMMSVVVPALYSVELRDSVRNMQKAREVMWLVPAAANLTSNMERMYYMGLNYMFPSLFLMIPLVAGNIIGAGCLVGEKESRTLETLLYTPVTLPQLFFGKLVAAFVPAYAVTLCSFGLFLVTVNVTGPATNVGFPIVRWLLLITTVCPALILLALAAMVVISAYASTFQAAQQLASLVVLPVTMLILAPMSGHVAVADEQLVLGAALLFALDLAVLRFAASRFTAERLVEGM